MAFPCIAKKSGEKNRKRTETNAEDKRAEGDKDEKI